MDSESGKGKYKIHLEAHSFICILKNSAFHSHYMPSFKYLVVKRMRQGCERVLSVPTHKKYGIEKSCFFYNIVSIP